MAHQRYPKVASILLAIGVATTALVSQAAPASAAGGLRFEEFKCIESTEYNGGDSPYFVVFIGKPNGETSTQLVRKPWWDNAVDDGYVSKPQQLLTGAPNGSLVMMTAVEEDDSPDITSGGTLNLDGVLHSYWSDVVGSSASYQYSYMRDRLTASVEGRLSNDDYIGTAGTNVTSQSGWLPTLRFKQYGSAWDNYKVWLRMV